MSHLESCRFGDELEDVEYLDRLLDPPAADLGGDLGLLNAQVRARSGAVGPLRDVVDVDKLQSGDRAQDLARRLPYAHALVQAAGVVIGDGALDRRGQLEPSLPDLL